MASDLLLREVLTVDLPIFFDFQLDPEAQAMAAFSPRDPADRQAFLTHWRRILAEPSNIIRTIVVDGQVVGTVSSYLSDGHHEVTYWLGTQFWGKGLATRALSEFLAHVNPTRPIYARAAKDNVGSLRVLEKCGFRIIGEDRGFARARGEEIDEAVLRLD